MAIREQDLGDRLAAIASQVSEPQFTIESVAQRIRQRRVRIIAGAGATAIVIALAVAAGVLGLQASNSPTRVAHPSPRVVWLPMKISVLGKSALFDRPSIRTVFAVPAGRSVPIVAQVTVPPGVKVRTLWLGIVAEAIVSGGPHGPTGWAPILLRTTKVLSSGQHTFRLHWDVPTGLRPGRKEYLVAYWVAGRSSPEAIMASLVIRRP